MNGKLRTILFIVIIALLLGIFGYCAYSLIVYYAASHESKEVYSGLADMLGPTRATIAIPGEESDGVTPTLPVESPYITVIHPDTGEEVQMYPEYEELFLLNPDLIGWITIEGTVIDYPVVQTAEDNPDYYLKKNYYGEKDMHGCIYAREQCDVFKPSDNITLYGHRMNDGTMFDALKNYKTVKFWKDHRYIRFDTLTDRGLYEIVAVFRTTAVANEGFAYHMFVDAETPEDFDTFIQECKSKDIFDTGVTAEYGDKLITLSTCEYHEAHGRLVVVAKRIA